MKGGKRRHGGRMVKRKDYQHLLAKIVWTVSVFMFEAGVRTANLREPHRRSIMRRWYIVMIPNKSSVELL